MAEDWSPDLRVCEASGRCRLWLGSYACGEGPSLQEAADDLVVKLLVIAMSFRCGGARVSSELGPVDLHWFEFIYELGEIASVGGDIRERVFGPELEAA
jgi:hypothetical protein